MQDPLANFSEKPDVGLLADELSRSADQYSREITHAEDTRYCRWPGQSEDGRKWSRNIRGEGAKAFPWNGASDTRPFLTDELVNSAVDLLSASFWRAMLKVSPVDVNDVDQSGAANTLIHWAIYNRLFNALVAEVELLGQYTSTYGWAALHVCWEQEIGLKKQKVKMEEIVAMAAQAPPGSALADLPMLLQNPEADDQVAEIMIGVFDHLTKARAKKAVKEMRETGEGNFPVPFVQKNQPSVGALVPFDDICFPPETADIQSARVVFLRRKLTEVQFRAQGKVYEWNEKWMEQVLHTIGQQSQHDRAVAANLTTNAFDTDNLLEVVWAYTKALDDDDIPAVYCTVFSPHVLDQHGSHELLDYGHGDYPFVIFRAETIHRKVIESRGIPAITQTWQQELKVQRDSIFDYTSICTLPPLQVPKGRAGSIALAPAAQLPVLRLGEIGFLDPPSREPSVAFNLMDRIEIQADRYFGRSTEKVAPVLTQMRQQRMVSTWLHSWTVAFRQILALCIQYLTPEEMLRITGAQIPMGREALQFDLTLKFDVRELASDLATEKLKAVAELVLPLDSAGVIDRAKLTELALRAIDPAMAEELVMAKEPAAQQMFNETNQEIALMSLGNPAKQRENDPTAQMRLQFGQQIIQANPKYQQQLMQDPHFKTLVEEYAKNLMFSVQQQQNATTGRLGVPQNASTPQANPMAPGMGHEPPAPV